MATVAAFKFDTPDGAQQMLDIVEGLQKRYVPVLAVGA